MPNVLARLVLRVDDVPHALAVAFPVGGFVVGGMTSLAFRRKCTSGTAQTRSGTAQTHKSNTTNTDGSNTLDRLVAR